MGREKAKKILFVAIVSLLGCILINTVANQLLAQTGSTGLQPAKIGQIIDGDTLDVSLSQCRIPWRGNPQRCRVVLACIDAPDLGQDPFYQDAKKRLEQLLASGSVMLRDTGNTSQGRIVAELFLSNQSVNLQMVREGKAVVFCRHLNNCAGSRNAYLNAEAAAKNEGLGVWNPRQSWKPREPRPCPS